MFRQVLLQITYLQNIFAYILDAYKGIKYRLVQSNENIDQLCLRIKH